MANSGLLTTAEVAAIRGVKRGTVSVWCKNGVIPRRYITKTSRRGDYRISAEWLDDQELHFGQAPSSLEIARRDLDEVLKIVRRRD